MKSALSFFAPIVTVLAGGLLVGFGAGNMYATNAAKAKANTALTQAHKTYKTELAQANQAATASLQAQKILGENYANLQTQYRALRKRAPLVITPVCDSESVETNTSPFVTLAAVRMWNGALRGADQPAGACGLASGTPDADFACADSAGLTLDAIFKNHGVNAQSCAEDRARQQALIDYLKQKQERAQ